ncbi:response regulator transcription factor [Solihabitans fulvus]|uniref:Response regulator transcription factor n=1 Tax=Solihabitans fulvus TaxID=1892852 RepID=A0A5B2WU06_9PSEU|nr:response regulator transcription factor [Solihabitans fulvus]KAA2253357.1 response regulator transcription factor [Solihabitans fulvus]
MIRVFLVDDQELVRTGCAMVVDAQPDMEVVGEAGDGAEALSRLSARHAHVVVMDVRMPRMDGVEATRRFVERDPAGPRILVLTTFDLDEYAFAALAAGASGFILKDAPAEDMLRAIRTVHAGDSVVAPSTTRRLIDHVSGTLRTRESPDGLTEREREVWRMVATGDSNADIATALHLSEGTVKTHVGRLLAKLGARDHVHAVIRAYETGFVRPGS